jgi:hypothetical protein
MPMVPFEADNNWPSDNPGTLKQREPDFVGDELSRDCGHHSALHLRGMNRRNRYVCGFAPS